MSSDIERPGHGLDPDAPGLPVGGDGRITASPQVADTPSTAPDGLPRRGRRTLAQREAAARSDLAALDAERRRLRTRGAIVAGTLLARAVRARPTLATELAAAVRGLPDRDREAMAVFAPEIG